MATYSNRYIILTECECSVHPRPALEHNINCPRRLGFFGAPSEWGVGKIGEVRYYSGEEYLYSHTWLPTNNTLSNIRKEKLERINNNKK